MAFVKLDTGILDSTLWVQREQREVFITALLMAQPYELEADTPQIHPARIEETGFIVPKGWYGFIPAAGAGIVRRAGIDAQLGLDALVELGSPDNESRSSDFDGRRLVRIDGGYLILNFMRYREKDNTGAARAKRYREQKREKEQETIKIKPECHASSRSHAVTSRDSSLADADADADADAEKRKATDLFPVARSKLTPVAKRGTRLSKEWTLPNSWGKWAIEAGFTSPAAVRQEAATFRDYWIAKPGASAVKLDWEATWRNWVRTALLRTGGGIASPPQVEPKTQPLDTLYE